MISKKQQKQFGKLSFERYSFTPNVDEVFTKIVIQVDQEGHADITTTAIHSNGCDLSLECILEELGNIGDLGIDFSPEPEDRERIAEWLAQIEKAKLAAA